MLSIGSPPFFESLMHDNNALALIVFVSTMLGAAVSVLWERRIAPYLFQHQEKELCEQIASLEDESRRCIGVNRLAEMSKLHRRIAALRDELAAARRVRGEFEISLEDLMSPSGSRPPRVSFESRKKVLPRVLAALPRALQELAAFVYWNLTGLVKYLLRFGHLIGLLYSVGNRKGIVMVPFCPPLHAFFFLLYQLEKLTELLLFGLYSTDTNSDNVLLWEYSKLWGSMVPLDVLSWCIVCCLSALYIGRILKW